MRVTLTLDLTKPHDVSMQDWVARQLAIIEEAAREDAAIDSAEAFTVSDAFTELETFDTTTVTLPNLARVVATLLKYIQNHGPRKA